MELTVIESARARQTVRMASQAFEVPLPESSVDVPIGDLEHGGARYDLSVSRPSR
jgi:hypothetical protein